ncbi:MAG: DNA polymerase I [Fibrobacteria bacterium]|nr:DNA polymerase I [Fibrobacteria bacterium]
MNRTLFLIDSSALVYRSFYAFVRNPLINSKGQDTSTVYGYGAQVLRVIQDEQPAYFAIVKDLKAPTFRHKLYKEYKANRKPMPEELVQQLPVVDEFIKATGLPVLSLEGYEADDIMATLALQAEHAGLQVNIVTKDKDMMQIVNENIRLFEPGKRNQPAVVTDALGVEAKFGVPPEKITDLLSLMGDAADNIPGVTKVGVKTAAELLNKYDTLENIYEHVDEITKKALKKNLVNDKEKAFFSKKLVSLECAVPLEANLEDLKLESLNISGVTEFLKEWELFSLLEYVKEKPVETVAQTKNFENDMCHYRVPASDADKNELASELSRAPVIALDTETSGLDKFSADLVGVCISTAPRSGWYLPVGHDEGPNMSLEDVKKIMEPVLAAEKSFVFHNAKFDQAILERYGLCPSLSKSRFIDTMVAAYLLNPGARGLSLDALALEHGNYEMVSITSLIGPKGKSQKTFNQVPVSEASTYSAEDADITFRLWMIFEKMLKDRGLLGLFFEMEMPLVSILHKMEKGGIKVDEGELAALSSVVTEELEVLQATIFGLADEEFNVDSTQQLSKILFEKLGLPAKKKTKTGFSTDTSVLQKLKGKHEIIDYLISYRELAKLKNTYIDVLPALAHPRTGRVHTSYSQTVTATGRLSSNSPNLQNIPIRTDHGKKIRACFIARSSDYVLLAADYSQVELRILAHLSGDPALCEAFSKAMDIHTRTASALFDTKEEDVTSDMRRSAKVVNFGVIYGMGARRLAGELKITQKQASEFIENYFARYTKVKDFMRGTIDKARQAGYVETITGRRRYLPELSSSNRMVKENAERMAANTPIQGSAADLIKKAMIDVARQLYASGLDCEMLLQVHDELVFEVAKSSLDRARILICNTMEKAMDFSVPLVVDAGHGRTWLEAH